MDGFCYGGKEFGSSSYCGMVSSGIFYSNVDGTPQIVEGALFNEYDYEYVIEARSRGGKGNKKRRRGGNGLR